MKTIKYIAIAILILILLLVGLMAYLGFFNKVEIVEKEVGPFEFVYEDYIGDYSKTMPIFDKVYKSLIADGITPTEGLGVYYDNPQVTPKEECRAKVGSILPKKDYDKFETMKDKYGRMTVEKTKAMVAEFPYKNKMSFVAGVIKVYPKFMEYAKEKGYETPIGMELYQEDKIIFMMEIK